MFQLIGFFFIFFFLGDKINRATMEKDVNSKSLTFLHCVTPTNIMEWDVRGCTDAADVPSFHCVGWLNLSFQSKENNVASVKGIC